MNRRGIAGRLVRYALGALVGIFALCAATSSDTPQFTQSAVTVRDGYPTLLVDGRPFFFYAAAFFYERIPATQWRASMLALRTLGFNTLDLYVPWNWHELADGDFDFDGRTNPQRNVRAVLALARELRFKLIVRPGPVIRNEWRNGGYPAWLLTRPEYGMPLHDVLEGRYPATATLQNANSDDAAAQWLANATHLRYASRWLRTALSEFVPYADLVVAVQLDDDQGAYIDNQTWPAPHLQAYLRTLESTVRSIVGPQLPVYINTYEMKVTAAAPVWAMGNWYQSEATSIGEHDRVALEFSTGLLQTQTRYPVAMSEFQAGWLAGPQDPQPRPADPTNTTLALHTLLGLGARGIIDFPAQDTINPAGWEAPFANASYAWGAALTSDLVPSPRYPPTADFGAIVHADGPELAASHRWADGAIAYLTSAFDEQRLTNADVFAIVARTQAAQGQCRAARLICDLVDLRFADDTALARYPFVVVPEFASRTMIRVVRDRLARYRARGGRILAAPPIDVAPHAGGIADATVLLAADGAAFIDIVNFDAAPRTVPATRIDLPDGRRWDLGPLRVAGRDALLLRRDPTTETTQAAPTSPPLPSPSAPFDPPRPCAADCAPARASAHGPPFAPPVLSIGDSGGDGFERVRFRNDFIALTISPAAGARATVLTSSGGACARTQPFTSVGALRDDVAIAPPLSTTDRIGKYTRSFPAGMFNRTYTVRPEERTGAVAASFTYAAPDVVPNGATFERTIGLRADEPGVTVTENVTVGAGPGSQAQRAVRYDSFDTHRAQLIDNRATGTIGFLTATEHAGRCLAVVAWPPADVEDVHLIPEQTSTVVRFQFVPNRESTTRYALYALSESDDVRAILMRERAAAGTNR